MDKSRIFSVRLNGKSTSFSIKTNIIAFYCVVTKTDCKKCFYEFSSIVSDIAKDWTGENAKGLSDFVVKKILETLLKKKELKEYKNIIKELETQYEKE